MANGMTCSICHRDGFQHGYDLTIDKVIALPLKLTRTPKKEDSYLFLCDECFGRLDLRPHDIEEGQEGAVTVEPKPQPVQWL